MVVSKNKQKNIPVVTAKPVFGTEADNLPVAKAQKILDRIKKEVFG